MEVEKNILEMFDKLPLKVRGDYFRFGSKRTEYRLDEGGVTDFLSKYHKTISIDAPSVEWKPIMTGATDVDFESLRQTLKEKIAEAERPTLIPGQLKTMDYITQNLLLLEFPYTSEKDRYIVYNTERDDIEEHFDYKIVTDKFLSTYGKDEGQRELHKWLSSSKRLCTRRFNQNSPRIIPVDLSLGTYIFNDYRIPEYRVNKPEKPDVEKRQLVKKFFEHFIPDEYQRDYVLAWIYTSLNSRCETFLCLVGAHGVGKTFFMDFLAALHGRHNSVTPKDITAQFNAYLAARSLVMYDEATISSNVKETFKRISNTYIQVERKGEDQREIHNVASICLASNYEHNLSIEPNDRRFSIPDLGNRKLENALGKKETNRLFKLIKDEEVLYWFYSWLRNRFSQDTRATDWGEFSPTSPLKNTAKFESCCIVNAPDEIRFVIEKLREKDIDGSPRYLDFTLAEMTSMYKDEIKNNPQSSYRMKRVRKGSIFFKDDTFSDAISKYKLDRRPVVTVEKGRVFVFKNNLDFEVNASAGDVKKNKSEEEEFEL